MMKAVEGTHVGFLHQITGNRARWQVYREWETLAGEEVLLYLGTQLAAKYIGL